MSAPLGSFVPRPAQTGDQFQARFALGRPLIVQVVAVDDAVQVAARDGNPATVKSAVSVHVWDLIGGQVAITEQGMPVQGPPNTVYCNVRWMAGALVDNLKQYLGAAPMPIKIISQKAARSNYNYLTAVPVEGPELQQVQAFFSQDPTRIEREAAAKAQAAATQAAAPAYQQNGFSPLAGVQPTSMGQNTWQQGAPGQTPQFQAAQVPAAAQFQPPPAAPQGHPSGQPQFNGQPGPVAQMPAQVAQQYAPVQQAMEQAQSLMQQGLPAQQAAQMALNGQAPAAAQQPAPGAPPWNQAPPAQAAAPGAYVQNSDVQSILNGLTAGQQPTG